MSASAKGKQEHIPCGFSGLSRAHFSDNLSLYTCPHSLSTHTKKIQEPAASKITQQKLKGSVNCKEVPCKIHHSLWSSRRLFSASTTAADKEDTVNLRKKIPRANNFKNNAKKILL